MTSVSTAELKRVFELQKEHQWAIKATTAAQRKQKLQKLKDVVLANAEAGTDGLRNQLILSDGADGVVHKTALASDLDPAVDAVLAGHRFGVPGPLP